MGARRRALAAALSLLVVACGSGSSPTSTAAPSAASPSEASAEASVLASVEPSAAEATPASSIDEGILEERGPGLTLKSGDSGQVDLKGGKYRVAWVAPGCTTFFIEWAPTEGDAVAIDTPLPSGEAVVDLPAGVGYLNRGGDCESVIRFEAAP